MLPPKLINASLSSDVLDITYPPYVTNSLSESPLHLLLWQIYRHMHTNLINVRATYAS